MIFRSVFGSVKQEITATPGASRSTSRITSFDFTLPENSLDDMPLPMCQELSDPETDKALQPIVDMAKSCQVDAKIEAARILCDISVRKEMHRQMCQAGCVQALVELTTVDHEWCNQHAICALANMSSSRPCQDMLLMTPAFFPALIRLVVDGPHSSAEMRRECARTLANICAGFGPRVVSAVGVELTKTWVDSVKDMRDSRLKLHAERAKAYLLPVLQCK